MWLLTMALGLQDAAATTYGKILNLEELTEESSRVITGTVQSTHSFNREGLIWTEVTLEVDEALVGPGAREVHFEVIGGTLDGVTLTVPGAPQFSGGQDVLIFLEGSELVGFGQGAFSLESGVASRGLGPLLPEGPKDFDTHNRLPNREDSSLCLQPKLWEDYADGWNLRSVDHGIATDGELELRSTQLLSGLEYRFQVCGDELLGNIEIYVVDEHDQVVADSGLVGREGVLHFTPSQSGEYHLGFRAGGLSAEASHSSLSMSIAFR